MTDRELMQMALDAIEGFYPSLTELHNAHTKTAEALRARLAQPEQEPQGGYRWREGDVPPSITYTTPPQREWQGLTDDEILEEYRQSYGTAAFYVDDGNLTDVYFARAIEAKLKEKNSAI